MQSGYGRLRFRNDGLLTIRSTRTGATLHLLADHWLDPEEEALLATATFQR